MPRYVPRARRGIVMPTGAALNWGRGVPSHLFPVPLPRGTEVASPQNWRGSSISAAALHDYGDVPGVSIATDNDKRWSRAYHYPVLELVPGVGFMFRVWYRAGSSGRVMMQGYGYEGDVRVTMRGDVGAVGVQTVNRIAVSDLDNIAHPGGIYELRFSAEVDAAAPGGVQMGIGPDSAVVGEDVVLYAAQIAPL